MAAIKKRLLRLTNQDIAAIVPGVLLFLYFSLTVRYSVAMLDESAYWLLGSRLSFGDRLISDEWHLIQFSALIDVPVYFLYTRIVGSTEGLILFARYAFIVFDALFYAFMCRKLRRYKTAGVVSAFLFCAMVPELFFSFSYCTVSTYALMALLLGLFADAEPKKPARLIWFGVLLAVVVLENPLLLAMYLLWAIFAAVYAVGSRSSKKPFLPKAAFLLEKRTFLFITFGSAVVFFVFVAFLIMNGAFAEIRTVLPYLFSGAEYNGGTLLDPDQLMQAVGFYNRYCLLGLLCCTAAAGALRVFRLRSRAVKLAVFAAACGFFAACCVHAGLKMRGDDVFARIMFCQDHNIPLLLFAPVPFLLSEKTDEKRICMLLAGYLFSVLMDIPSKSFIGIGGFIVRVPLVPETWEFLQPYFSKQSRADGTEGASPRAGKKNAAAVCAVALLCLSVCACWDAAYVGAEGAFKAPERLFLSSDQPMDHTIEKGPLKGLKTTRALGEIYEATLRDMDVIRQTPDCAVAMLDSLSYPYLYLDRPYATFSMTYSGEFDRLLAYWSLPYTAKPDYLYLPYYNPFLMFRYEYGYLNARLAEVRSHADCEVTQGEAGYIIRVRSVGAP